MPNFPIFLDLENQNVLVVGGGRVAERKVCKLLPYGPKITVVAPEICESILALSEVTAIRRRFRLWDLYPRPAMVIAALMADGTSEIEEIGHIERGYENIVEKLRGLGADIRKVERVPAALDQAL